jgi:hypothetical protein
LTEKRGPFRIQTASEKIERDTAGVLTQHLWITDAGERMIISNKIKGFALCLKRDRWPHHAEIIADVQESRSVWNTG